MDMTDLNSEPSLGLLDARARAHVRSLALALAEGDRALADDIEQETLAAAVATDSGRVTVTSGWLSAVARNVARVHWRRQRTGPRFLDLTGIEPVDSADDPAESCSQAEIARILRDCLGATPPIYQEVIRLRVIEGHPPRRVAAILAIPVETVRTRFRRGIDLLRTAVGRRSHDD